MPHTGTRWQTVTTTFGLVHPRPASPPTPPPPLRSAHPSWHVASTWLLCACACACRYGSVAGGLLSDKYVEEPKAGLFGETCQTHTCRTHAHLGSHGLPICMPISPSQLTSRHLASLLSHDTHDRFTIQLTKRGAGGRGTGEGVALRYTDVGGQLRCTDAYRRVWLRVAGAGFGYEWQGQEAI